MTLFFFFLHSQNFCTELKKTIRSCQDFLCRCTILDRLCVSWCVTNCELKNQTSEFFVFEGIKWCDCSHQGYRQNVVLQACQLWKNGDLNLDVVNEGNFAFFVRKVSLKTTVIRHATTESLEYVCISFTRSQSHELRGSLA